VSIDKNKGHNDAVAPYKRVHDTYTGFMTGFIKILSFIQKLADDSKTYFDNLNQGNNVSTGLLICDAPSYDDCNVYFDCR